MNPDILLCTVFCEKPGCRERITVSHDITDDEAAAAATALRWKSERRTDRWHHLCPNHSSPCQP